MSQLSRYVYIKEKKGDGEETPSNVPRGQWHQESKNGDRGVGFRKRKEERDRNGKNKGGAIGREEEVVASIAK